MVVHGPHMWVVMGGPEVQFGTRRGELEIGPKFSLSGPPWAPLKNTSHLQESARAAAASEKIWETVETTTIQY